MSTAGLDDDLREAFERPSVRTFGLLLEAHARLTRDLDARLRNDTGTTLQTLEVLLRIARSPEGWIPLSSLADTVALTSGGLTRLVDRLERDGLVERHRCETDGRVVRLMLSAEGERELATAMAAHVTHLADEVEAPVDADDVAVLQRSLDALRAGQRICT